MMKREFRYISLLMTTVCVAFVGCKGNSASQDKTEIAVKTITVKKSTDNISNRYVGTVEPDKTVNLSFSTMGTISEIFVSEGSRVYKGDKIASLDKTSLKSSYDATLATLNQAKDAYARMKQLHDNGSLAEIKWIEIQSKLQQAESMETIARKALADADLKAPSSGIISTQGIEVGTNVAPAMSAFKLMNIDNVKVKISVPETEIYSINTGDLCRVTVSALNNKTFEGRIKEKSISANQLTHTYDAKILIPNRDNSLMPGMVTKVDIIKHGNGNAIVLPANAVQLNYEGGRYVWIYNNGVAEKRDVTIAGVTELGITISEGVVPGDKVIVEGMNRVSNGMKVKE